MDHIMSYNGVPLKNEGYLEIILGPMFSGKTSKLLDIYELYISQNTDVFVINYFQDTRYSKDMLASHDKKMIPCINVETLRSLDQNPDLIKAKIILINEGQFFEDLYDFTLLMLTKYKKNIYVCGLDGDFKRNKFGNILDIIPLCDKVIKLKAICDECKDQALFTYRLSAEKEQKVIGAENYVPLCRKCYNKKAKCLMMIDLMI
jgi:thymidine kinase